MPNAFARLMGSEPVVALVKAGATLLLALTFAAAGLGACLIPAVTTALARQNAATELSTFSAQQLVEGAQAVRDYSFGPHDRHALLAAVYRMNQELEAQSGAVAPASLQARPTVDPKADPAALSTEELEQAFQGADQRYCLDEAAISHLDDVNAVASTALPPLALAALLAVAGAAHVAFYRGWRALGPILAGAGALALGFFALVGAGAALNFQGFFSLFHSLFFQGQSWVFPYDSLLICMLPEGFWIGMGALWLVVSATLSILSLILGIILIKKSKTSDQK